MILRRLAITALLATAGAFTACGSDDSPAADTVPAAEVPDGSAVAIALDTADVEFAQGMIAHHEQAIEMAEIALDPNVGASAEVVDLATRIRDAQDPEVELMTGWLVAAGEPITMDLSDGHDMSSMEGMMTADQLDALAAAAGAEFDQMWLEMMIAHHEGAISQSETVLETGSNADVLDLADQIILVQQAEIAEMQALLGELTTRIESPVEAAASAAVVERRRHRRSDRDRLTTRSPGSATRRPAMRRTVALPPESSGR